MTYLVERLAELRRHLDHLRDLRPRVVNRHALERDLSLHNDVLFSLLTICQLVIDIAGDLSARVELTGGRDEIGSLSRSFNRMTGKLESHGEATVSGGLIKPVSGKGIGALGWLLFYAK